MTHRCWRPGLCFLVALALSGFPLHADSTKPGKAPPKPQADEPLPAGAVARLGTTRFRDPDGIVAADLSPDGKIFAVLNAAQTVRLLDRHSGKEVRHFAIYLPGADTIRYMRDGKTLLLAAADSEAQTVDARTGKRLQRFKAPAESSLRNRWSLFRFEPAPFTLSADGRTLALIQTVPDRSAPAAARSARKALRTAVVWNVQTGEERGNFEVTIPDPEAGTVRDLVGAMPSPDGKLLAVWSPDGKGAVLLLDPETGKEKRRLQLDVSPSNLTFTPDGRTLLACKVDGLLNVVDMQTGKTRARLATIGGSLRLSPNGKTLAVAVGEAQLWDLANLKRLGQCAAPAIVSDVSVGFTPDGKAIAWGAYDATMAVSDVPGGVVQTPVHGHRSGIAALAFADAGRTLASVGNDGTALAWDVATRRIRHEARFRDFEFGAPAYLRRLKQSRQTALSGYGGQEFEVAVAGPYALVAGRYRPALYDWTTGGSLGSFTSTVGSGSTTALAPDGSLLAILDKSRPDRALRLGLWDPRTGRQLRELQGPEADGHALALAPAGKGAALATQEGRGRVKALSTIRVWNPATGALAWQTDALPASVQRMAYTPDGRILITVDDGGIVQCWDAATGKQGKHWAGVEGSVTALAISPDGRLLALVTSTNQPARFGFARRIRRGAASSALGKTSVRVYDVASGKVRFTLQGGQRTVTALAFSPDGRTLATGGTDTTILLWNVGQPGAGAKGTRRGAGRSAK